MLRELRAVRTRYSAGRSSVVLPRIGGSHCDRAQALALGVYEHDRHSLGTGGTLSRPSGQLTMPPRFREEEPALVVGDLARTRLAAYRGERPTTRLRPHLTIRGGER